MLGRAGREGVAGRGVRNYGGGRGGCLCRPASGSVATSPTICGTSLTLYDNVQRVVTMIHSWLALTTQPCRGQKRLDR